MPAKFLGTARPALYIALLVATVAVAALYSIRADGAFACQANGYGSDRYLAYCNVDGYGEYDHGALWFDLEPKARAAARKADVVFLGNSRQQFAFSTAASADWFKAQSIPYYLLGFSENERYHFEEQVMNRMGVQPGVYVINVDGFFEETESVSAGLVMHDDEARGRIDRKRVWQQLHQPVCTAVPALCGRAYAIFRSRTTGAWKRAGVMSGGRKATSEDPEVEEERVDRQSTSARIMLGRLPVLPECTILTFVPTVEGRRATAAAIADAVGRDLVAPSIDGLLTFDGSHLDEASAERWAAAFFQEAGPRIARCLAARSGAHT
jgi:hypothetical protein